MFDWGGTLMREFDRYEGKMADWPRVEAMPGAAEALTALQADWHLAIATNATASEETDIRRALHRVDLDGYFEKIYCFRVIGFKKPERAFYEYILQDLQLPADRLVMVGDDFHADVEGAIQCGLRAIWYNPFSDDQRKGKGYTTIHDLRKLSLVV